MEEKCESCDAKCCKYVVLDIDTPETKEDFENVRWYVAHKDVEVYVDFEGVWNVRFITMCEHLNNSDRCDIYDNRPEVCREFSYETCSVNSENEDVVVLKDLEDVDEYIKNVFNKGKHLIG